MILLRTDSPVTNQLPEAKSTPAYSLFSQEDLILANDMVLIKNTHEDF